MPKKTSAGKPVTQGFQGKLKVKSKVRGEWMGRVELHYDPYRALDFMLRELDTMPLDRAMNAKIAMGDNANGGTYVFVCYPR
jgi:hypothetical protein